MSWHHHHTDHGLVLHHTHADHEETISGGGVRPAEGRHSHIDELPCRIVDCKYTSVKEDESGANGSTGTS